MTPSRTTSTMALTAHDSGASFSPYWVHDRPRRICASLSSHSPTSRHSSLEKSPSPRTSRRSSPWRLLCLMDLANLRPAVNWPIHTAYLFLESLQYTTRQVSFFGKKLLPLFFPQHMELHWARTTQQLFSWSKMLLLLEKGKTTSSHTPPLVGRRLRHTFWTLNKIRKLHK